MNPLEQDIEKYYTEKVRKHGATPQGVDWNGEESQTIRFDQLLKIVDTKPFTLLDYGCGYGALLPYLKKSFNDFSYSGFDVSDEMIAHAKRMHSDINAKWFTDKQQLPQADYTIASGIFNVKQTTNTADWQRYVLETLDHIHRHSKIGFSFNILTKYSDQDRMKNYLFYADPLELFDYCKTQFSPSVALLHDYKLYEFTILVRKNIL
jgi:SAM-dependent methyltransferase